MIAERFEQLRLPLFVEGRDGSLLSKLEADVAPIRIQGCAGATHDREIQE
jgi:hypothetical protein